MLALIATHETTHEEIRFELRDGIFRLGRSAAEDDPGKLVVHFDKTLSRHHASIHVRGNRVEVVRDGSRHPLLFHDQEQDHFELSVGSSFRSGQTVFRLQGDEGHPEPVTSFTLSEAEVGEVYERNSARALDALLRLQPLLNEHCHPAELFQRLLPVLADIVPTADGLLALRANPDGTETALASIGARGAVRPSETLIRRCLNEGRPVCYLWDGSHDPTSLEPTAVMDVTWALAVPIPGSELSYVLYAVGADGLLPSGSESPGELGRAVIALVSQILAQYFEGRRAARLATEVKAEREKRLLAVTLRNLTAALTSSLNLEEVMSQLLAYLEPVVPYQQALALLKEGELIQVLASRGASDTRSIHVNWSEDQLCSRLTGADSMVIEGNDPLLLPYRVSPDSYNLCLALQRQGALHGLVILTREQPFSSHEQQIAEAFTDHAEAAVQNALLYEKVRLQATTDQLTGVRNRRHFLDTAHSSFSKCQGSGGELCAILIDVDHFKSFNDQHGHAVGDLVLIKVAQTCAAQLRQRESFGRYGGEEFAAVLEASKEDAIQVAERLREAVEEIRVGEGLRVTISLGLAFRSSGPDTLEGLLQKADQALYQAKEQGRNRACVWSAGRGRNPDPSRTDANG